MWLQNLPGITVNRAKLQALFDCSDSPQQLELVNLCDIARQLQQDANGNGTSGDRPGSRITENGKDEQGKPSIFVESRQLVRENGSHYVAPAR